MKKIWSDFIKSSTRESNARDFYNAYKFAFQGDLARAFEQFNLFMYLPVRMTYDTLLPVLTKCRTPLLYADLYYTRIFRPKFGTPNYRV